MPPSRVALWVASIGAVALAVRAAWLGDVPFVVAIVALLAYLIFVVVGVLVPQLEMFGDVVSRGDVATRAVALTFDDGPHPVTTRAVLGILREAGVPATFFVVGEKAERHPDVIREIASAGHTIGVHGYVHRRLYSFLPPRAVASDIARTSSVVERACGERPRWFRPPVGQISPRTSEGARLARFPIVVWSVRGRDGLPGAKPNRVVARVEKRLKAGAIVLLHDATERDDFAPASLEALPKVLAAIAEKGLRVAPLQELIGDEK